MPPKSATDVQVEAAIWAFLSVMGRKRGAEFLRKMDARLAGQGLARPLNPARSAKRQAQDRLAELEALAQFRASLPGYLSAMLD